MPEPRKGQRFKDFQEFEAFIDTYAEEVHTVFTIADSKRNVKSPYVKYGCKHFGKRRIKSRGLRPNQSSYKINCPAFVYARQFDGCVAITGMHLEHCHVLDPQMVKHYPERRRLEGQAKEEVTELLSYGIKPGKLQEIVRAKTGKAINIQDIANLRYSIRQANCTGGKLEEALGVLAQLLQEDPDAVVCLGKRPVDGSGPLKVLYLRDLLMEKDSGEDEDPEESEKEGPSQLELIFFQTGDMRATLQKFPELLLMDSTYNVTENRMPLSITMCMDGYGSGRAASYTFVADETHSTLSGTLQCLKSSNESALNKTKVVVIDKDTTEISSIHHVLSEDVLIQICTFHVLKNFKEVSKDIIPKEVKAEVRQMLQNLTFSKSEEEYLSLYNSFENLAPKEFLEYYNKNWHSFKEAWTDYQKLVEVNFGNSTNNRLENLNGKLKEFTDRNKTLGEAISGILSMHQNKGMQVSYREFLSTFKERYVIGNDDADVDEIVRTCTPFAAKLLRSEIEQVNHNHTTAANGSQCSCPFFKTYALPCRHIFFARQQQGLPKFVVEEIADRWLINSRLEFQNFAPDNCNPVVLDLPHNPAPYTESQKFKAAHNVATKICNLLSRCGTAQFQARLPVLQKVHDLWEQQKEVTVGEVGGEVEHGDSSGPMTDNAEVDSNQPEPDGVLCFCQEIVSKRSLFKGPKKGQHVYRCAKGQCAFERYVANSDTQEDQQAEPEAETNDSIRSNALSRLVSSLTLPASLKVRGRPKKKQTDTAVGTTRKVLQVTGKRKYQAALAGTRKKKRLACQACSRGDLPMGAHTCIQCGKNVHIFDNCSVSIGGAEGYGQKRVCYDCHDGDDPDNIISDADSEEHDEVLSHGSTASSAKKCACDLDVVERTVRKNTVNKGRRFLCCPLQPGNQCKFFQWVDKMKPPTDVENADTSDAPSMPHNVQPDSTIVVSLSEDQSADSNFVDNVVSAMMNNNESFLSSLNVVSVEVDDILDSITSDPKTTNGMSACLACQYNGPPSVHLGSIICVSCGRAVHTLSGCSENRYGNAEVIEGDVFRLCFQCCATLSKEALVTLRQSVPRTFMEDETPNNEMVMSEEVLSLVVPEEERLPQLSDSGAPFTPGEDSLSQGSAANNEDAANELVMSEEISPTVVPAEERLPQLSDSGAPFTPGEDSLSQGSAANNEDVANELVMSEEISPTVVPAEERLTQLSDSVAPCTRVREGLPQGSAANEEDAANEVVMNQETSPTVVPAEERLPQLPQLSDSVAPFTPVEEGLPQPTASTEENAARDVLRCHCRLEAKRYEPLFGSPAGVVVFKCPQPLRKNRCKFVHKVEESSCKGQRKKQLPVRLRRSFDLLR